MKRRQFLKNILGVSVGAMALPSVVKAEPKGLTVADIKNVREYFERNEYKGEYLYVTKLTCLKCGYMFNEGKQMLVMVGERKKCPMCRSTYFWGEANIG